MKFDKTSYGKFHDAIHKMNEVITIGERNSINRFRRSLWEKWEKINEISHFPSLQKHPLGLIAKELKSLIDMLPVLSGKISED